MDSSIANPYQTPSAEVMDARGGQLQGILPRFSAWAVFGLAVITFGIYSYYWLYSRTRLINPHVQNPIGRAYMITTLILMICSWASNVVIRFSPEIGGLMGLVGMMGAVMLIIWVYKVRNRLHQLQGLTKGNRLWIGPILTFFFSVIYLQYKINQSIDSERGQV